MHGAHCSRSGGVACIAAKERCNKQISRNIFQQRDINRCFVNVNSSSGTCRTRFWFSHCAPDYWNGLVQFPVRPFISGAKLPAVELAVRSLPPTN